MFLEVWTLEDFAMFRTSSLSCCHIMTTVELSIYSTIFFGRELIVLHMILSMFVKFVVHTWGWCGCLNKELVYLSIGAKLILTLLEMLE